MPILFTAAPEPPAFSKLTFRLFGSNAHSGENHYNAAMRGVGLIVHYNIGS